MQYEVVFQSSKEDKDLMRPLYDRYRAIKRMLAKPMSVSICSSHLYLDTLHPYTMTTSVVCRKGVCLQSGRPLRAPCSPMSSHKSGLKMGTVVATPSYE